ncbi:MAG: tryptophanase [bacterium]|nr:tryptophanase [bacterium]
MKIPFEPYRSRIIEPLTITTEAERCRYIREAGYNPFLLKAEHVLIDLVTDSGTSALSVRQWSAMHGADESFTGSRSFHKFVDAGRKLFGTRHVIPCHQGRAGEHLLAKSVVRQGDVIPANTHFATTRANFEVAGGRAIDLPIAEQGHPDSDYPFKGNIDIGALERSLLDGEISRIPFVLLTVTDNAGGGQPVSLANLRETSHLCRAHSVPLLLDAARIAENCYLIKQREASEQQRTVRAIADEVFTLVDGLFMSMKKDGLGNCGGLIAVNDDEWAERIRANLLISEGVPSAGGLAGRDLESMTVALDEMFDDAHLEYRIASVHALGQQLVDAGVPVLRPFGGHAVYIDGRRFCDHLSNEQLPAWSLSAALYVASGVRSWETGNVMQGRFEEETQQWSWPRLDLLRLAIPRRVYTHSQLEYAGQSLIELYRSRTEISGLRFVYRPQRLAQFVATFEPVSD